MARLEDADDDEAAGVSTSTLSSTELYRKLADLSAQLVIPEELIPTLSSAEAPDDAIHTLVDHTKRIVRQMRALTDTAAWTSLSIEQLGSILLPVLNHRGEEPWCSIALTQGIDDLLSHVDQQPLSVHLLTGPLRQLFTNPHPSLNPESARALSRPAGGADANMDFHDVTPPWKGRAFGVHNALAWCCSQLTSDELEKRIGVVLPPPLVMMDDWEPPYRGRGAYVLASWLDKMPAEVMRRMGVDQLLVKSLVHTLSLHANPPLKGVLPVLVRLVERGFSGEKRAKVWEDVMEKSICQGWIYAPPGPEGKPVLVDKAEQLEIMCDVLGEGIARWLKMLVPYLLQPLHFSPTKVTLPHTRANLHALLKVMRALGSTGRIPRWRGQILDMCGRYLVQSAEVAALEPDLNVNETHDLVRDIFAELERQSPSIREVEFSQLAALHPVFKDVIPVTSTA